MSYIAGAPLTVEFNNKKYIFYPLKDKHYAEFEIWAQDRYIEVTKRNVKDLPEAQATMLLSQAFDRAALITFSSIECRILMRSIEGATRLLWMSLSQGDETITIEKVKELVDIKGFVEKGFEAIAKVGAPPKNSKKKVKKVKKQAAKKSTSSSARGSGGRRNKSQK